uniref:Uncharacterized protein n=1 Tax=Anguilla anguilla TaxID=7936 RepID=A0A0E9RW12_ANGAN
MCCTREGVFYNGLAYVVAFPYILCSLGLVTRLTETLYGIM